MKRSAICWSASAVLAVGIISTAAARPGYLAAFKAHYNTASGKANLNKADCSLCHVGAPNAKRWNVYGTALGAALGAQNVQDRPRIVTALQAAETKTNPVTKLTFRDMIAQDKLPGTNQGAPGTGPITGTWEPLYSGVDMQGWTKMNAGNWEVKDFILRYTGGGNGWLRSNKQFQNYSAVIVWRYPEASNANDSGIFLRAGMAGSPWPNGAVQLNMGPGDNFGSLGGAGNTTGVRARADLIKPNDWNTYQVTVFNGRVSLAINGQRAWDATANPTIPDQPGYLGIQAENRPLEIAQFWIMELK